MIHHAERKSYIFRYQQKTRRGSLSSAREFSQASSWATLQMPGEAGKEVFIIADVEELAENDASDVYSRRTTTKEVPVPKEGDKFIFPFVNGTTTLTGKGSEILTSDRIRQDTLPPETDAVVFFFF